MDLPLKNPVEFKLFDIGLAAAFGLLHLLLYAFFPRKRANLFFSLFAFAAGVRILTADLIDLSRLPYTTAMVVSYVAIWSIGFAVPSFVAYLYSAFGERFPIHFWIVLLLWTVLTATRFFTASLPYMLPAGSLLIIAFVAIESLRVIGRAIWQRRDGAWIVGLGVVFIIVAPLYNAVEIMRPGLISAWALVATQISLIGILVANSVFLARNFAQTNKDLEQQLIQVKELSARDLEHERTAADLRLQNEQERAQRALVEQEIALAASIQLSLFPESLPKIEGYDIAAFNRPARDCGGDYYDVLKLDERNGSFLACVADVSGKGLPASLLMSNLQATLRALAPRTESLKDLAAEINDLLYATSPPDKFVTAILAEFDDSGNVTYVNAGHNECFVVKANGAVELLRSTGLPLGMFPAREYDENRFACSDGDLLALFSDGVPEAHDKSGEEWGEEVLKKILIDKKNKTAEDIIASVTSEIDGFSDGADQYDDITLMIVRAV
ncbi:MAG: SpoIIE family protein phosphatase [Pyrinomonadaceae bacterium]